jgi:hypothetical protein
MTWEYQKNKKESQTIQKISKGITVQPNHLRRMIIAGPSCRISIFSVSEDFSWDGAKDSRLIKQGKEAETPPPH